MTALITILAVLFLSLIVIVPLLEKYSDKKGPVRAGRMQRYIFPMMAVVLVLAILRYYLT